MGGVVKEYQVVIDPQRLAQYGISLAEVKSALDASNQEAGGSSIELAEAEYMVRASGYLQTLDDFNHIVLKVSEMACPFICVMLRRSRLARRCAGALPN
ncbi:cation efflux system protein [Escherichia coli]|uniref:Cation efflux system protein n=1 Tax=Escherichia coli TaxID=562 RepID=A0A376P231_ECOLX|nr:cation efflux system protein [Escherichia coli]